MMYVTPDGNPLLLWNSGNWNSIGNTIPGIPNGIPRAVREYGIVR